MLNKTKDNIESMRDREKLTIHFDGASKGNPGPASIGAVIAGPDGETVLEINEPIGRATNNFAEYTALIRALEEALKMGSSAVDCFSDSELVVRQMTGKYRVKSESLLPLWQQARELSRQFEGFSIRHVPRTKNRRADQLASKALEKKG